MFKERLGALRNRALGAEVPMQLLGTYSAVAALAIDRAQRFTNRARTATEGLLNAVGAEHVEVRTSPESGGDQ